MDALTPARPIPHRPLNGQVSLLHITQPSMHSVTKHLTRPIITFLLPAQRDGLPGSSGFRGTLGPPRGYDQPFASSRSWSGLRLASAGSSLRAAESCSQDCYGLHVRLRLLPTPPRGDAVTFGYRERASPGGGLPPPRSRLLAGAWMPGQARHDGGKTIGKIIFCVTLQKMKQPFQKFTPHRSNLSGALQQGWQV